MKTDACILCGAAERLTPEHIWPTWFSNMRHAVKFGFSGRIAGRPEITRDAQKFDLAPKVLCERCNGEWGSQLETRCSRHLKPMIDGARQALSLGPLRDLATWATLKVMVAEYESERATPFYSEEDRAFLRTKNRPPHGTSVGIGRFVGASQRTGRFEDDRQFIASKVDGFELEYWVVNFAIGQVVFHVFALSRFGEMTAAVRGARLSESRPDWGEAITRIWPLPAGPIGWPPQRALDDAGFSALTERWLLTDEH